ncbi:MAG: HEAT repeat domain-containing protein, partial [Promethearchaeota archaeon]
EVVGAIPKKTVLQLLHDKEWRLRQVATKVISRRLDVDPGFVSASQLVELIDDPDFGVQGEVLKTLVKIDAPVPASLILDKLKHPNEKVRSGAAMAFSKIDLERVDSSSLPFLIKLMDDPDWRVRSSVFEAIGKMETFPKHALPVEPILNGLFDQKEKVRDAASHALGQIAEKAPFHLNVDELVGQYKSRGADAKVAIAPVLGKLLQYDEGKILPVLLDGMSHPDPDLKRSAAEQVTLYGMEKPEAVLEELIKVPEKAGFVKKGIVSESLVKIGSSNPEVVVPFLLEKLRSPDEDERTIAATVIGEIGAKAPELVDVQLLAKVLLEDGNNKVRKQVGKSISDIAEEDPHLVKGIVVNLLAALKDEDESVRITISKAIMNISSNAPELIPIPPIIEKLADDDTFTRESLVHVLGNIGQKLPGESIKALISAMGDPEWIVRNAAADALGKVAQHVPENRDIPALLENLLDDEDKWVRSKAASALAKIAEKNPHIVDVEKVLNGLKDEDENVQSAHLQIAGAVGSKYYSLVIPKLTELFGSPSKAVRDAAVSAFTKIGQSLENEKWVSQLLALFSDEVPIATQQSAALVCRRLFKYGAEKEKKRAIQLLTIRCEMSQDEVICGVLRELMES